MLTVIRRMKLPSRRTPTGVRRYLCASYSITTLIATVAQEKGKAASGATEALAGLHINNSSRPPKPPARPAPPEDDEGSIEEEDENDPFGDRNAV